MPSHQLENALFAHTPVFLFFDICNDFHYSEFTWVCSSWCRNSPARQLFVQQHVYVNSNENSTLLARCEGNLPATVHYAHDGQVMRKRVPWYHEITYHESILPQQCVDYCDIKIISRIVSTVCFSLLNSINMCAICNLALMGLHSFTKLSLEDHCSSVERHFFAFVTHTKLDRVLPPQYRFCGLNAGYELCCYM